MKRPKKEDYGWVDYWVSQVEREYYRMSLDKYCDWVEKALEDKEMELAEAIDEIQMLT